MPLIRETQRAVARRLLGFLASAVLSFCAMIILAGCSEEYRDVSRDAPYASMVGRTYRVVGDVGAFGIYVSGSDRVPAFVALYPQAEAPSGPEVTFSKPVEKGRTFRIVGATLFDTPIDDTIFYVVELQGEPIAAGVPVHVRLRRNNSLGDSAELNPQYYELVK